jgi:outer membrane protein
MRIYIRFFIVLVLLTCFVAENTQGQAADRIWTLQMCINQALQQNIQIQQSVLNNEVNQLNTGQARASRFPSVSASVNTGAGWSRQLNDNNEFGTYSGSNNMSYSVAYDVRLYNGFKIRNSIRQSEMECQAGQYEIETMKESVSLSVLDAYLQVLYAGEQVKNGEKQIELTEEQLHLSEERMNLGAISKSEYLQVRSELASENLTLAKAQSLLAVNRITLMQLMELPASSDFSIEQPDFGNFINQFRKPVADSVFATALEIKPRIKNSELLKKIAGLDVDIARAGYQPVLSLNGGLSTAYTSQSDLTYVYQEVNKISPSIGLSLSMPIYQNKQIRTNVSISKIGLETSKLNDMGTKNQLRKEVEQACTNVITAEKEYEASQEKFNAAVESYNVTAEKFNQGLINSVDFLIQKTNLISSESQLLQSKYNLVFSYKILDFYLGIPLTLE